MKLMRFLPRFRRAYRELAELEARENWSRSEVEEHQFGRLNAVWSHAISFVPHYRHLAAAKALPPRFGSLDEFRALVPLLHRTEVRDRPLDFFSARAERGSWTRTGGSTGTPTNAFWGREAHLEMLRAKYRFQG